MTTRISVTRSGRRVGALWIDDGKAMLVIAPTSTEQELYDALAEAYAALQGRERKVGVEG